MSIVWTSSAIEDLAEARAYIAADNPKAAQDLAKRILAAVDLLLHTPDIGRPGRKHGTRELRVAATLYLIIYRRKKTQTQILRVYHSRRRWPLRGGPKSRTKSRLR